MAKAYVDLKNNDKRIPFLRNEMGKGVGVARVAAIEGTKVHGSAEIRIDLDVSRSNKLPGGEVAELILEFEFDLILVTILRIENVVAEVSAHCFGVNVQRRPQHLSASGPDQVLRQILGAGLILGVEGFWL